MTERAVVVAPRLAAAMVRLPSGEVKRALNALNLRCPPGSTVLVTLTNGRYSIVGRER